MDDLKPFHELDRTKCPNCCVCIGNLRADKKQLQEAHEMACKRLAAAEQVIEALAAYDASCERTGAGAYEKTKEAISRMNAARIAWEKLK